MGDYANRIMHKLAAKDPGEPEFHQAVHEVAGSVELALERNPRYMEARIFERIVEPERVVMFRVPWVDDAGDVQVNRGFRVEMNSALGPYKGGLRFHPTVYLGMLKFLAFEQIFKNALTTLPIGGGKGGADFDPKGRSDGEVMRFCQSFMTELQRHIGPYTDVPAGDIGVGGREIGFLFGQYKRIRNEFTGVLTGKGLEWGGSLIRPEATGYGAVYFAEEMLDDARRDASRARRAWSRARATSRSTPSRSCSTSARSPSRCSDSGGFIYDKDGIDREKLAWVMELKNVRRGRIMRVRRAVPERDVHPRRSEPSTRTRCGRSRPRARSRRATQNEISAEDAGNLLENGVYIVAEGANMPTEPQGIERFVDAGILYGPGKAANAGGVAVSGLEMAQNSERRSWRREKVDERLHGSWSAIHTNCRETADEYDVPGNYVARREHRRVPQGRRRDARAGDRLDRLQAGHRPLEEREDRADLADVLVGDVGAVAGREPVHLVRRAAVGEPVDVGERLAKRAPRVVLADHEQHRRLDRVGVGDRARPVVEVGLLLGGAAEQRAVHRLQRRRLLRIGADVVTDGDAGDAGAP